MTIKWRRIATWGLLAGLLLAGVGYAFWPRPVPVDLAVLKRGPMTVTLDEEGRTRVRDVFVVSSPVAGRVRRIESNVGDAVVAGKTVVAYIEPTDPAFLDVRTEAEAKAAVQTAIAAKALAEAKLEQAQAELDFASAEVDRARRLISGKIISQRAFDEAERSFRTRVAAVATVRAELKMRESEVAQARARLVSPIQTQKLHGACACVPIPAPVSGRILRIIRESEGVVQSGETLMEIGNPRDLEVVVDFLSTDAVKVAPGQRVIIDEWGGEEPLTGTVRRVEPYGFTKVSALGIEEQRVNVIVDFTDPSARWERLGHGYRVEVRVVLWQTDDVLPLPLTALFRAGERWAVFVEKDGRARRRHVSIGRRNGMEAEIVSGLTAGDRVVLHPSDRTVDGVRIAPRS